MTSRRIMKRALAVSEPQRPVASRRQKICSPIEILTTGFQPARVCLGWQTKRKVAMDRNRSHFAHYRG